MLFDFRKMRFKTYLVSCGGRAFFCGADHLTKVEAVTRHVESWVWAFQFPQNGNHEIKPNPSQMYANLN
jgi:hypothetical protein